MERWVHINGGNLFGGIESLLITLSSVARRYVTDLEQLFVMAFEGRFSDELRRMGENVRVVGPARLSRPWSVHAARRGLREALGQFDPTAVIAHDTWPLAVMGPAAAPYPLYYYQHMPAKGSLLE